MTIDVAKQNFIGYELISHWAAMVMGLAYIVKQCMEKITYIVESL